MSDWSPSPHELFSDNNPYKEEDIVAEVNETFSKDLDEALGLGQEEDTSGQVDPELHRVLLVLVSGDQPELHIGCSQKHTSPGGYNHQCPLQETYKYAGWDAVRPSGDDEDVKVAELEVKYDVEGYGEDAEPWITVTGVKELES
jgi:hypothetical protein